jgi:hypothetical protein
METIQSRTFRNDRVTLDDTIFLDYIFIDCVLEYSGQPVVFERTFLRRCHYVFFAEAQSTIRFLQNVGLVPPDASGWTEMQALAGMVH